MRFVETIAGRAAMPASVHVQVKPRRRVSASQRSVTARRVVQAGKRGRTAGAHAATENELLPPASEMPLQIQA